MRVELLSLDLVLIFVRIVEHNYLHGAFKCIRVFEIDLDTTFTNLVLRLFPCFNQLTF